MRPKTPVLVFCMPPQVIINEVPVVAGHPVPIYPGRANLLSVPDHPGLVATVRISPPEAPSRRDTAQLQPGASLDLGPFTAPAAYDFESGVVWRRGYQVDVRLVSPDAPDHMIRLGQGLTRDREAEWFFVDGPHRVVLNDGWIPADQQLWHPLRYSGLPMDPPVNLRMLPEVLVDQDQAVLEVGLRADPPVPPMSAELEVTGHRGERPVFRRTVALTADPQQVRLDCHDWPLGDYRITVFPVISGRRLGEGPQLVYRRRRRQPATQLVSALAPFRLQLDTQRQPAELTAAPGRRLESPLAIPAHGAWAIYGRANGPCALQLPAESWLRRLQPETDPALGAVLIGVVQLTAGQQVVPVHDTRDPGGLQQLRLVPVTQASAMHLASVTRDPPFTLRGIDDWWTYLPRNPLHPGDLDDGELGRILQGQREIGITSVAWAIGRSWVQYPTRLPQATVFPCTPLTPALLSQQPWYAGWAALSSKLDPLQAALDHGARLGVEILPWLAMNRHYSPSAHGGVFHSPWVRDHPQLLRTRKDGQRDTSRVDYFHPEARQERLAIMQEVMGGYAVGGLVVGCCRQPPLAGYDDKMVAAYMQQTDLDPRTMDRSDDEAFSQWQRWRAGWFTLLLRELRESMPAGRTLTARVPGGGLSWCTAGGMDLKQWLQDGLIDELLIDPLDDGGDQLDHDLAAYVSLAREHGVRCLAGINATTGALGAHGRYNPTVGLRRAIGLAEAGVDGFEIYEAEILAYCSHERWLAPLWGDPERARRHLLDSNLEAVYPVTASDALLAMDNHSYLYCFSLDGTAGQPLPRGRSEHL